MDFNTIVSAKEALKLIPKVKPDQESAKKFFDGDHWQGGSGWIGPMIDKNNSQYQSMLAEVQRAFVGKNSIKEVVLRHTNGVVGKPPSYDFTVERALKESESPSAEEQELIDEAVALMMSWWDDRGVHKLLQDAVKTMLTGNRCCLRLFVPAGVLQETENGFVVPVDDLAASLKRVYLKVCPPDQAAVYVDDDTQHQLGIFSYQKGQHIYAELSYLDEAGQTVIRIIGPESSDENPGDAIALELNGKMPIHEMNRESFLTTQALQNQRLLNLALTMLQRNVVLGGFLERVFLNAQLPGREITNEETGEPEFVPEPHYVGAGATNYVAGIETNQADGTVAYTSPSMERFDPVPVGTFTDTKAEAHRNILEETFQLHSLISGDASASGESRKQAMSDYMDSLMASEVEVLKAIRWLTETALQMAATFSGKPDKFISLRPQADCKINTGPRSPDDRRVDLEQVDKKVISLQTARQRDGVDDPNAEAEQVSSETEQDETRKQQTLSTAVLNAQRSLNAGQQSNGLEQTE